MQSITYFALMFTFYMVYCCQLSSELSSSGPLVSSTGSQSPGEIKHLPRRRNGTGRNTSGPAPTPRLPRARSAPARVLRSRCRGGQCGPWTRLRRSTTAPPAVPVRRYVIRSAGQCGQQLVPSLDQIGGIGNGLPIVLAPMPEAEPSDPLIAGPPASIPNVGQLPAANPLEALLSVFGLAADANRVGGRPLLRLNLENRGSRRHREGRGNGSTTEPKWNSTRIRDSD